MLTSYLHRVPRLMSKRSCSCTPPICLHGQTGTTLRWWDICSKSWKNYSFVCFVEESGKWKVACWILAELLDFNSLLVCEYGFECLLTHTQFCLQNVQESVCFITQSRRCGMGGGDPRSRWSGFKVRPGRGHPLWIFASPTRKSLTIVSD
jgi:hypothetical protein